MEGIVGFEGRKDEITSEVKFSKLKQLELVDLPNLLSFYAQKEKMGTTTGSSSACAQPLFTEKVIFPILERLTIDGLGNIIKIWDKQSVAIGQEQGSFCQLMYVTVGKCEKLMHLFPSNMHPLLKNLEMLGVRECKTMKGIAEFEGEIDEDGLRNEIEECDELEEIFSKDPKEEKEAINDDIIVFPRLQKVRLQKLPKLKSFYTETQGFFSHKIAFPVLETLDLGYLDKITRIWHNQLLSEPEKEAKSFCELVNITVENCNQLEYVLPFYMLPQLKNLQELRIWSCSKMELIISNNPKEKEATNNNDTIRFPQLKKVDLSQLPNLKSFICRDETQLLFSNTIAFPVLETLDLWYLDKITRIWDNQPLSEPEKEAKLFCELVNITVEDCNQLEYILPFYMLPQLKNLQELRIWSCSKMEVIISNNPKEKEATNNNDTIRFPQLKKVDLSQLPNLKSFICSDETQLLFSNTIAFPVLETLDLTDLDKITRIWDNQPLSEPEKEAKSFCELVKITVEDCNQLEYVLPFYMLPQLKNLQRLSIRNCTKVEVIISNNPKEKEATNNNGTIRFCQLKILELEDLPNFKSFICSHETQLFFSNKVAFPVLKNLSLSLDKITRIWDNQPLSEPEKEAKFFCELMVIKVDGCNQLEYVLPFYMLPQLKNLQELSIRNCTKVEVIISNNPKEKEATNNNDTIRFPQLKTLELEDLPNFKSFIYSDETQLFFSNKVIFPVLKKLSIQKMHKIIEIWDKQSIAVLEEQGSFCQLTDLDVFECEKLMHVFPSKMHSPLKNLKMLRVRDCPTMEGIVEFEGERDEYGLRNEVCFSELSSLELSSLPNLKSFCTKLGKAGTTEGNSTIHAIPLFNIKIAFPVLERLILAKLDKITRIWDNQPLSKLEKEAKSFCDLKEIIVVSCEDLEYVLPIYMLPQLKNLHELWIQNCTKMEVIISNNPKEKEATNNNDTIRFPQLKTMILGWLPNLKSFICSETKLFFSNVVQIKDAFPVLESISIEDLKTPKKKGFVEDSVLQSIRFRHLMPPTKKDAFPVLIQLILDEDSEILRDGTYTKEVSMEECSTSGKESDPNGEELDKDLETPTKPECNTSGEESDLNGEELDEDLENPTKEECGTSGKQNDHNGEQG